MNSGIERLQQELIETRSRWEAQSRRSDELESVIRQVKEEKQDIALKMEEIKGQLEESQRKLNEAENACSQALAQFQVSIIFFVILALIIDKIVL